MRAVTALAPVPSARVLVTALALSLGLPACAAPQKPRTYADEARLAYENAMDPFNDDDCLTAEPMFRKIRSDFPYSRYAALAELREADCLERADKHAEAIEIYQRFARVRASHEDVPYARFKAAQAQFEQIPSEWFASPPAHERDLRAARDALRDLRRFLLDYPADEHAKEAAKMEERTLKLLAQHELFVADFYLRRDHPEAALGRIREMLESYDGSGYEPEALFLLARTQLMMKEPDAAHATFRALMERYPRSGMAVQAQRFLTATGG